MGVMVRIYDVEPREDRPTLPLWAVEEQGFPVEVDPHIGDELKISEWSLANSDGIPYAVPERGETHYWRVVRRTHDLAVPQTVILGVRLVPS